MKTTDKYIGLDVHKDTIVIVDGGSGQRRQRVVNAWPHGPIHVQREEKPVKTGHQASPSPGEGAGRRSKMLGTEPSARATAKIQTA